MSRDHRADNAGLRECRDAQRVAEQGDVDEALTGYSVSHFVAMH